MTMNNPLVIAVILEAGYVVYLVGCNQRDPASRLRNPMSREEFGVAMLTWAQTVGERR